MIKLVAKYEASGQSQRDFAVTHGLSKSKLHYWVKKSSKSPNSPCAGTISDFLPLEITPSEKTDKVILIRLVSGIEIEIPV